jgi:hypothetical protein
MAGIYIDIPPTGGGAGGVDSVNGYTGIVVLVKSDIGLSNVDNTADINKPVSIPQELNAIVKAIIFG